jgi:hypothetical protein
MGCAASTQIQPIAGQTTKEQGRDDVNNLGSIMPPHKHHQLASVPASGNSLVGHLEVDSTKAASSQYSSQKEPEDIEYLRQQYIKQLETSLEQLKNIADTKFARIKTLKDLWGITEEDVLNAMRDLLWECANQPERSQKPWVSACAIRC